MISRWESVGLRWLTARVTAALAELAATAVHPGRWVLALYGGGVAGWLVGWAVCFGTRMPLAGALVVALLAGLPLVGVASGLLRRWRRPGRTALVFASMVAFIGSGLFVGAQASPAAGTVLGGPTARVDQLRPAP